MDGRSRATFPELNYSLNTFAKVLVNINVLSCKRIIHHAVETAVQN